MPLDNTPTDAPETPARTRKAYADHETPFVRNAWYVAARSDEIGQEMFPRTLLEQRMVFYASRTTRLSPCMTGAVTVPCRCRRAISRTIRSCAAITG